ncbi:MAG TPA: hypothetical protein VEQ59_23170 [Polyangiaceae bacterium]|nr:hypothetical protein [Polyangiaceae bacterium]
MTWTVAWRPLAERDFTECIAHIAQDNTDAALRFVDEGVSELAAAAVAENEQQASTHAALSEEDLPAVAASGEQRLLVSVGQVRNVNALRPDQTLKFGPQLTVVYGDNAAGKSGYCRVLKKVYRARVVDDILGDVRSEVPAEGKPTATFTT